MKHILFYMLLLISLSACIGAPAPGSRSCNDYMALCIEMTAKEPILVDEPVIVNITVSGKKDIPGLQIFLERGSGGKFSFEDPSLQIWKQEDAISWATDFQANQPLTFTGRVLLPTEEGGYTIIADAFTSEYGRIVANSLRIYIAGKEGKVYYSGTKIPITEGPLPTSSPGPFPTSYDSMPNPIVTEKINITSPVAITVTPSP